MRNLEEMKKSLIVPEDKTITIRNRKVIYFGDMMFTNGINSIEEEYEKSIKPDFNSCGVDFHKVECTESFPYESVFDTLLFDYGGMMLGNSMITHLMRTIVKLAEDFPNREFVMVSSMTQWAAKDYLKDYGKTDLKNVFLSVEKYCDYLKQLP